MVTCERRVGGILEKLYAISSACGWAMTRSCRQLATTAQNDDVLGQAVRSRGRDDERRDYGHGSRTGKVLRTTTKDRGQDSKQQRPAV